MECGLMFAWLKSAQTPPEIYRGLGYSTEIHIPHSQLQMGQQGMMVMCITGLCVFYMDCCPCI